MCAEHMVITAPQKEVHHATDSSTRDIEGDTQPALGVDWVGTVSDHHWRALALPWREHSRRHLADCSRRDYARRECRAVSERHQDERCELAPGTPRPDLRRGGVRGHGSAIRRHPLDRLWAGYYPATLVEPTA